MRVLIKIKPISTNNKIINYILQIIVVNVNGPVLDYSQYHKCLDLYSLDPDGSWDYLIKDVDSSLSCHKLLPYYMDWKWNDSSIPFKNIYVFEFELSKLKSDTCQTWPPTL